MTSGRGVHRKGGVVGGRHRDQPAVCFGRVFIDGAPHRIFRGMVGFDGWGGGVLDCRT